MAEPHLVVTLPNDRTYEGSIRLVDENGSTLAGPFRVRGEAARNVAHNPPDGSVPNPSRNATQKWGNTPLGGYDVGGVIPTATSSHPAANYGATGAIRLVPRSGDALVAASNGRVGLLIHSQPDHPSLPPDFQSLRPTGGCLRMLPDDVGSLISVMSTLGFPRMCSITPDIEVIPESTVACYPDLFSILAGVADPPPGFSTPSPAPPPTPSPGHQDADVDSGGAGNGSLPKDAKSPGENWRGPEWKQPAQKEASVPTNSIEPNTPDEPSEPDTPPDPGTDGPEVIQS